MGKLHNPSVAIPTDKESVEIGQGLAALLEELAEGSAAMPSMRLPGPERV